MPNRKVTVEIDCYKLRCGDCEFLEHGIYSVWCGLYNERIDPKDDDDETSVLRCPKCLDGEKESDKCKK